MRVVVRCDASATIGSGHVMRCLTLADTLARRGASVSFVCRPQPGDLQTLIERRGYRVSRLDAELFGWEDEARQTCAFVAAAGGTDLLIVDHYGLDARFESRLRQLSARILVIDDLADRPHDCDLLLDQNLYEALETRYVGLIPASCKTLLGPRYALLRPEFLQARLRLRPRLGELHRLLISFGGSDPSYETAKALAAVSLSGVKGLLVDVVVGISNPNIETLRTICAKIPGCVLHTQVDTMAALMSRADLALGSGGCTTWERCYLGLPSLTVVVAHNQHLLTEAVAAAGAAWNLGWHASLTARTVADLIAKLKEAPELLALASARGFALMGTSQGAEHPLLGLIYGDNDVDTAPHAA